MYSKYRVPYSKPLKDINPGDMFDVIIDGKTYKRLTAQSGGREDV